MRLLIILALISTSIFALTGKDVDFNGYLRAGAGVNTKGGDQECFSQGWGGNEFRLGNECNNYGELEFKYHHKRATKKDSSYFHTKFRMMYEAPGEKNWENSYTTIADGSDYKTSNTQTLQMTEAYVEGGNHFNTPFSYWVGKRFYRWQDAYMNDIWYFGEFSANGAGISNLDIGIGKLALAHLIQLNNPKSTENGKIPLRIIDARLSDVSMFGQKFRLWGAYGFNSGTGTDTTDGSKYISDSGFVLGALMESSLPGGFNHFSVTYGDGLLGETNLWLSPATTVKTDRSMIRALDYAVFSVSRKIELHVGAMYDRRTNGSDTQSWYNVGVQPSYKVNDFFHITGVIGHSVVDCSNKSKKTMTRLTIAPTITAGNSSWARPVLRAFYTQTMWNNANKGVINSGTYKDEKSGGAYGFQAEVWF